MIILGIETSCDETAISLLSAKGNNLEVLSNVVSSQVKLHAKWGGVVPNLAAREHLKNIIPVLKLALSRAKIKPEKIDLISVTEGPGLIPALLIGTNAAKTLAYAWNKPLLGIHHIEGHIYANFINEISVNSKFPACQSLALAGRQIPNSKKYSKFNPPAGGQNSKFPILCLVVSGGHTQLVLMKKHLNYEIIGETQDDAAGEAFDKVARILNLGYPGGPAIAKYASQWKSQIPNSKSQKNSKFEIRNSKFFIILPRPMLNSNDFNFSFSGLKTAVLYATKKHSNILKNVGMLSAMCAEFQQAAIDVLVAKTIKAAKKYNPKTIMLAGGVAANKELRKQLGKAIKKNLSTTNYQLPTIEYTGDNAAMIASAGYFRWKYMTSAQKKKASQNWKTLEANANLKLK
jgi:N6-L-threonylcarbamoyladenine synthase